MSKQYIEVEVLNTSGDKIQFKEYHYFISEKEAADFINSRKQKSAKITQRFGVPEWARQLTH